MVKRWEGAEHTITQHRHSVIYLTKLKMTKRNWQTWRRKMRRWWCFSSVLPQINAHTWKKRKEKKRREKKNKRWRENVSRFSFHFTRISSSRFKHTSWQIKIITIVLWFSHLLCIITFYLLEDSLHPSPSSICPGNMFLYFFIKKGT